VKRGRGQNREKHLEQNEKERPRTVVKGEGGVSAKTMMLLGKKELGKKNIKP